MKSCLTLAASFLLAAGFLAGQTAPANVPTPTTQASTVVDTAPTASPASPPATPATTPDPAPSPAASTPSSEPDLSFKPNPAEAPLVPGTKTVASPKTTPLSAPKAPAKQPAAAAVKPPENSADIPLYVLGPNDVISIQVFGEGNVTGSYGIGPDGRISVPLIGTFTAIGFTLPALRDLIAKKLEDTYIIDPTVNVQLLRSNSKKYTLIGGVGRNGPVALTQETTVLDAIAAAGGFKDFANPKKIVIMRSGKKFYFNWKEVIKGQHMEQNITLEDGDLIIVPE